MKKLILAAVLLSGTPALNAQMPTLTAAEQKEGFKLMFDGKTLNGWRGYKDEKPSGGWRAEDGLLVRLGGGGDLMTTEQYADFEMRFEWKITEYGNSGVIYRVGTTEPYPWHTGPEYQILDNGHHPDGKNPITSAGSNYAVNEPVKDASRKIGKWNEGRIVAKGNHVEHWLNGVKVVDYEIGSADWNKRVQASKFGKIPPYGTVKSGYIALQDHESVVVYRNLKIKRL